MRGVVSEDTPLVKLICAGKPVWWWLNMFYLCHEYRTDGGTVERNKKQYRSGYWTLTHMPFEGTILDQPALLIEVFNLIRKVRAERS